MVTNGGSELDKEPEVTKQEEEMPNWMQWLLGILVVTIISTCIFMVGYKFGNEDFNFPNNEPPSVATEPFDVKLSDKSLVLTYGYNSYNMDNDGDIVSSDSKVLRDIYVARNDSIVLLKTEAKDDTLVTRWKETVRPEMEPKEFDSDYGSMTLRISGGTRGTIR